MQERNQEKKQRIDTKNEAKEIESDNFTTRNQILRQQFGSALTNISHFGATNNIFADCTYYTWGGCSYNNYNFLYPPNIPPSNLVRVTLLIYVILIKLETITIHYYLALLGITFQSFS